MLLYVSNDYDEWTKSDAWKDKASKRSTAWWDKTSKSDPSMTNRELAIAWWDEPSIDDPSKTNREQAIAWWDKTSKNDPSMTNREYFRVHGAKYNGDENGRKASLKAFDDDKDSFLIRCNYHGTEAKCERKSYTVGHYGTNNCFKNSCLLCTGSRTTGRSHSSWEKIGNRCLTREEINTVYDMKKMGASLAEVIETLGFETEEQTCSMVCCDKPATFVPQPGRGGSRYLCNDEKCRNRCEWGERDSSGVLKRCTKDRKGGTRRRFCGRDYCAGLFKDSYGTGFARAFKDALANSKDVKKLS
jgi:hypothetical protein